MLYKYFSANTAIAYTMYQVRREEEPVKVVQRKVISHSREDDGEQQQSTIELKLFGSWQTEPIEVDQRTVTVVIVLFLINAY